jgi:hypothetical protein
VEATLTGSLARREHNMALLQQTLGLPIPLSFRKFSSVNTYGCLQHVRPIILQIKIPAWSKWLSRVVTGVPLECQTTGMYRVLMPRECQVGLLCLPLSALLNRCLPQPYHRHSVKPSHNAVLDILLEGWACARLSEFNHPFSDSTVDSRHLGHQH